MEGRDGDRLGKRRAGVGPGGELQTPVGRPERRRPDRAQLADGGRLACRRVARPRHEKFIVSSQARRETGNRFQRGGRLRSRALGTMKRKQGRIAALLPLRRSRFWERIGTMLRVRAGWRDFNRPRIGPRVTIGRRACLPPLLDRAAVLGDPLCQLRIRAEPVRDPSGVRELFFRRRGTACGVDGARR